MYARSVSIVPTGDKSCSSLSKISPQESISIISEIDAFNSTLSSVNSRAVKGVPSEKIASTCLSFSVEVNKILISQFWVIYAKRFAGAFGSSGTYTPPALIGHGTIDEPYLLYTAEELYTVRNDPCACYTLAQEIILPENIWIDAIIPVFSGTFDGNNLTIRSLTSNGYENIGLFGIIETNGTVKNLIIEDVNITGSDNVGAITGYNKGMINNCIATGVVIGINNYIGGIAGYNDGFIIDCGSNVNVAGGTCVGGIAGYSSGEYSYTEYSIERCYSKGTVAGRSYIGGLVGINDSTIFNCYSTGAVTGENKIGGLIGDNDQFVFNCYSTGFVSGSGEYIGGLVGKNSNDYHLGPVDECFWDIETSGMTESEGGTGLTTEQMMDIQTYQDTKFWDFDNVWMICDGNDYPRLQWENIQYSN